MNVIKFSHEYPKLHGQTSAELLTVRRLKIDASTPRKLIEYDTTYDGGRYPLRHGVYLQLIFLGNLHIPFCTIRAAYPPSKVHYYLTSIGKVFAIETPTERKCKLCKHYNGMTQSLINFGDGGCLECERCKLHGWTQNACDDFDRKDGAQ